MCLAMQNCYHLAYVDSVVSHAQYDQVLYCPLTESLDFVDSKDSDETLQKVQDEIGPKTWSYANQNYI